MASEDLSSAPTCNLRMIGAARYIPRAQWDALARRGYHRHAWFSAAESSGAEPRHVGVFRGSQLLVVIPAYLERKVLDGDPYSRWLGATSRIAATLGAPLRSALTIGAPLSASSDVLGDREVLTDAVLDEALELLESEARAERVKAIVWPFVDANATPIREAARRRGFHEGLATSGAVMDVDWTSPQEYLESRPKGVQRTLRNELAWVHDQGVHFTWESDLRTHAETFDALYRASYVARNGRVATLAFNFFRELAAQSSEGVRVQCAWKGKTLLAMGVALDAGGRLDLCLRAQTDETRDSLLTPHCLCYDPVAVAIAEGITRIDLGPGALVAKLHRGARLNSRVTLVRGLAPAARAAVRVLTPLTNVRNRARHRRLLEQITSSASP
ncbi:MAG: GNAT family N-acetyltransferase [Gemmatimonadota bacterium]